MFSNLWIKPVYVFILVNGVRSSFSFTVLQRKVQQREPDNENMGILKREKKKIQEPSKPSNISVGPCKNNELQLWDLT